MNIGRGLHETPVIFLPSTSAAEEEANVSFFCFDVSLNMFINISYDNSGK